MKTGDILKVKGVSGSDPAVAAAVKEVQAIDEKAATEGASCVFTPDGFAYLSTGSRAPLLNAVVAALGWKVERVGATKQKRGKNRPILSADAPPADQGKPKGK